MVEGAGSRPPCATLARTTPSMAYRLRWWWGDTQMRFEPSARQPASSPQLPPQRFPKGFWTPHPSSPPPQGFMEILKEIPQEVRGTLNHPSPPTQSLGGGLLSISPPPSRHTPLFFYVEVFFEKKLQKKGEGAHPPLLLLFPIQTLPIYRPQGRSTAYGFFLRGFLFRRSIGHDFKQRGLLVHSLDTLFQREETPRGGYPHCKSRPGSPHRGGGG